MSMTDDDAGDSRFGIQSVEIAGTILLALSDAGRPLQLKAIAAATGLQASKVHRYLVSLSRIGLVTQEQESGHYGIGMNAIRLGLAGLRSISAVKVCSEILTGLRDETEETALLSIWTDKGPVVVRLEESSRPVFMNIRVGSILPLMQTATGRLFAALLDNAAVAKLLRAEKAQKLVPPDWKDVEAEIRNTGISVIAGTLVPSVAAVAGAVFDHQGRIAAVIGILGSNDDLHGEQLRTARQAVDRAARSASDRLGFTRHEGASAPK